MMMNPWGSTQVGGDIESMVVINGDVKANKGKKEEKETDLTGLGHIGAARS